MTDPVSGPVLSAGQKQAAEAVLTRSWGERAEVRSAERIWDRENVVRLELAGGRSAVLKRRRHPQDDARGRSFERELAALDLLNGMPVPVAPRLLGADAAAGILLIADLGQDVSLADSLLTAGRERAEADLIAYARALGSMHAWTMQRADEPASRVMEEPAWLTVIANGKKPFLAAAALMGLPIDGVASDIDQVTVTLRGTGDLGLVHGDPCPDNVLVAGGACRIVDFEAAGWGAVVLDVGYLLAPFPSCWCFAGLPAEMAAPAVGVYRETLDAAGICLGTGWDECVGAALAGWIVARGRGIARLLDEDDEWGTTTMRPRLLAWLRSFLGRAGGEAALPRLRGLFAEMHDQLSSRWPEVRVPEYPPLARPGSQVLPVPEWWPRRDWQEVDP
ncbi:MAG TPA: aminoglycoside phosphotransferase family protein [Streptosporangiaceae bacterium]|nr:aminoglycoside phosphotransferase family protein [Streptosporangiaceae bacterium]